MTTDQLVMVGLFLGAQTIGFAAWVVRMGTRISVLEDRVSIFWKNVSFDAAKILHSPDPAHRRMDELIERFLDDVISEDDKQELTRRLKEKIENNGIDSGTRTAASQMLRAIEVQQRKDC